MIEVAQRDRSTTAAITYVVLAGLQRGVGLLILPFVSRVLSPAEFGAATMISAGSVLLVSLLAAPLDTLIVHSAPRAGTAERAMLRVAGLYCYIALPLIAAVPAITFALFVPQFLGLSGTLWAIEAIAVGFQPAASIFALSMVKSQQQLRKFVVLAGASIAVVGVTKVLLIIVWPLGVFGWVMSDLISAVFLAVVAAITVRPPAARIDSGHIRAVAGFALPLIPHCVSFWAISSLSRPALAAVSTLTQVGLLSVGLSVASAVGIVTIEINRAVQPRYSLETFPAPTARTRNPVRWQIFLAFAVPAVAGSLFSVVGQWIFTEPYWDAFSLTGVLLLAQVAYGFYPIAVNYLVLTAGISHLTWLATGAGALAIFALIFLVGGTYGAMGVSLVTLAGYTTMAAVAFLLTRISNLEIQWRSWNDSWMGFLLAAAALLCSVAALLSAVGSSISRSFAISALVLVGGGALLMHRQIQTPQDRCQQASEQAAVIRRKPTVQRPRLYLWRKER